MSENQNRGIRDFSQYDSMTTEELEQILRLDAEAPEGAESDTEELLYVMEVLARRRNTNIAGKTAQEAWESFQENYMPKECTSQQKRKSPSSWYRRGIAAAATIALVILIPISVRALSWGEFWEIVARWAKETFSFVSSGNTEYSEPEPDDNLEYSSLQDILQKNGLDASILPSCIPEGFALERIEKDVTPIQELYSAFYLDGNRNLCIQVRTYLSADIQNSEAGENPGEIYTLNGINYYIFENKDQIRTVWITGSYECLISGDLSVDEIKMMIDSIRKG